MARTGPTGRAGGKRARRTCHPHLRAAVALRPALGQCRRLPGLSPGPPLAGCRAAGGRALAVDAAPAHRLPGGLYRVRLVLSAHLAGAAGRARSARLLGRRRAARGGSRYRYLRVGAVLGPVAGRCRDRRRCLPVEWDRGRRRRAPELRDRVLGAAIPLLVCRWAAPRGLGSGPRRLAAAPVPRPARRRRRRPHHSLRAPTAGRAGVRWCRSLRYSHDGRANAGERLAHLDSAGCLAGCGTGGPAVGSYPYRAHARSGRPLATWAGVGGRSGGGRLCATVGARRRAGAAGAGGAAGALADMGCLRRPRPAGARRLCGVEPARDRFL